MAAKLKDGVFLGDADTSQDLEFIVANKVSRIINCAGREIPNSWERTGVRYLTYCWPQSGNCIVFDESNSVLDEVFSFIEEGVISGEAVLLHSLDGASRAAFVACMYFMLKYRWTLPKTLGYLRSKRRDLSPRPGFGRQLQALNNSLQRVTKAQLGGGEEHGKRFGQWDVGVIPPQPAPVESNDDEALLAHTFLNARTAPMDADMAAAEAARRKKPAGTRLRWRDEGRGGGKGLRGPRRALLERPASAGYSDTPVAVAAAPAAPSAAAVPQSGGGGPPRSRRPASAPLAAAGSTLRHAPPQHGAGGGSSASSRPSTPGAVRPTGGSRALPGIQSSSTAPLSGTLRGGMLPASPIDVPTPTFSSAAGGGSLGAPAQPQPQAARRLRSGSGISATAGARRGRGRLPATSGGGVTGTAQGMRRVNSAAELGSSAPAALRALRPAAASGRAAAPRKSLAAPTLRAGGAANALLAASGRVAATQAALSAAYGGRRPASAAAAPQSASRRRMPRILSASARSGATGAPSGKPAASRGRGGRPRAGSRRRQAAVLRAAPLGGSLKWG